MWRFGHATDDVACPAVEGQALDRVMMTINGAPQLNGRIETFATRIPRGRHDGDRRTGPRGPALVGRRPHRAPEGLATHRGVEALFAPLGIPVLIGADADQARIVQMGTTRGSRGVSRSSRRTPVCDRAAPQPGEKVCSLRTRSRDARQFSSDRPAQSGGFRCRGGPPCVPSALRFAFTRRVTNGAAEGNIPRQRRGVQRPRGAHGGQRLSRHCPRRAGLEPAALRRREPPAHRREVNRGFVLTLRRRSPATSARSGLFRTVAETAFARASRMVAEAMADFRPTSARCRATGRTPTRGTCSTRSTRWPRARRRVHRRQREPVGRVHAHRPA